MVKKIIYFFLLIVLSVFYAMVSTTMSETSMLVLFTVAAASLFLFVFKKENNPNLKGQFFKHSTFFLVGFCIVHFQYYIDYLIGNFSSDNLNVWVNRAIVVKSFTLSVIGLISFFLGYLFYRQKQKKVVTNFQTNKIYDVKILVILAAVLLGIYFYTVNPLYLAGFYGAENMGTAATYSILAFTIIVYAVIIQNCRNLIAAQKKTRNINEYIKHQGYFFTALIIIYLLSVITSGDRGPIITLGIAYVAGYFIVTRKKMSWKIGIVLMLAGAAFLTLLGIARSLNKGLDFSTKIAEGLKMGTRYQEISFLPQTQDLASSVKSLHITVDYVPEKHDFLYGRFQFQQLFVAIPFSNVFNQLAFADNSAKFNSSASFVTWIDQGENPNFGEGSTCIADFYFDFGLFGVIAGMFLFGYLIRMAEVYMYSPGLPTLFINAFLIIYISYAFYIARSSFLFSFRTVVWVFVLLLINKYVFNRRAK